MSAGALGGRGDDGEGEGEREREKGRGGGDNDGEAAEKLKGWLKETRGKVRKR